jgi:hypothetical protein
MMENKKASADRILYEYGLWDMLNKIGKAHIIGSYRMDMIVSNDLDIDVLNRNMSCVRLYELSRFIIDAFSPVWYEAKQELSGEGKTVWFHGFETTIAGELWNVDIWFFDQETIDKAEAYCDDICMKIKTNPDKKESIIEIKKELISRGLYGGAKYAGMDVYEAVISNHVCTADAFISWAECKEEAPTRGEISNVLTLPCHKETR